MRWVVDAMNVIGSRPDGWWRDRAGAMRDLAERLRAFASARGERVLVVFDGRPFAELPEEGGGLEIAFAASADDEIVRRLADDENAGETVVVTSDRELAERVRALGVEVRGAGGFRRELDEVG